MADRKRVHITTREEWREWLSENHRSENEIWLVYFKKHTGKPRVAYNDAVEEALCFGWIDSIVHRIDENRYEQKFTPRKPDSSWSPSNIQRMKKLLNENKVTEAGLKLWKKAEQCGALSDVKIREKVSTKNLVVPDDLRCALQLSETAYGNWDAFAPSHKNRYIAWIEQAKRKETRLKRIAEVVSFAEKNLKSVLK